MVNITNATTGIASTGSPIIETLQYFQTLAIAEIFGMSYTAILLIAFFGFKEVTEKWKFCLFLMFLGGIMYNSLVPYIKIDPILSHLYNFVFFLTLGIIVSVLKKEFR